MVQKNSQSSNRGIYMGCLSMETPVASSNLEQLFSGRVVKFVESLMVQRSIYTIQKVKIRRLSLQKWLQEGGQRIE